MITVTRPRGPGQVSSPLRALVRITLDLENARAGSIGVRLTDDAELRALNRRWRGIDRATDVLSFPYEDPGSKRGVCGDLVISIDRARDQARRYRVTLGREMARLVVHGTLHLAGHDHHRPAERRRMRLAETRAMRAARASILVLDAAWRMR